jgi:hypothetical protein
MIGGNPQPVTVCGSVMYPAWRRCRFDIRREMGWLYKPRTLIESVANLEQNSHSSSSFRSSYSRFIRKSVKKLCYNCNKALNSPQTHPRHIQFVTTFLINLLKKEREVRCISFVYSSSSVPLL